jgi:hypothetical protein
MKGKGGAEREKEEQELGGMEGSIKKEWEEEGEEEENGEEEDGRKENENQRGGRIGRRRRDEDGL